MELEQQFPRNRLECFASWTFGIFELDKITIELDQANIFLQLFVKPIGKQTSWSQGLMLMDIFLSQ